VRGMTDGMTIGERVAFYRQRRGLTQVVLAGLAGRTEDWLRKVEHDVLPLDRLSVLRRLAYALDVALGDLIGEPVLMAWADEPGRRTVPALRVALMDHRQFLTGPRPGEPVRLDTLAINLDEQWGDYQNSRYARLTQRLPLLITDAQAACQHYGATSDDGLRAHALAAAAHQLATALLTKLGEADLAAISASRGLAAANASGDILMIGSLYRSVAHALLSIGEFEQERRAYATCRKVWPEIKVMCSSQPLPLDEYIAGIGDVDRVINMLVMPANVADAFQRLVEAGYTSRLI